MTATIDNKELVIRIPLQAPTASKSGKSMTVATSHGCQPTGAQVNGKPVIVGVNAFIK